MIANVQHWTELIAKRFSGNIREDEARMLDAWLSRAPEHREYYQGLVRTWEVTGRTMPESGMEPDWSSLEKRLSTPAGKISMPQVPKVNMPRITPRVLQIAAAILVLLVLGVTYHMMRDTLETQVLTAEAGIENAKEIKLPDGSIVTLRKGSTLQYDEAFTEREVTLLGEAFFSVTHDEERPFSVTAGNSVVRVLGTKFNLKATPGQDVELFVEEGRVAFAPAARKFDAKIFSAGQAGVLTPSAEAEVERAAAPGHNIKSWIDGKLVFDHATLDHVLVDIERHFAIPIVADSMLYKCELKADFENATLENVLETLRFSLNLQIDKTGDQYIVSGQPCATESNN